MTSIRFAPRILFLSTNAARVRAQLDGEPMTLAQALPLRDDISTDEITPLPVMVHFDATLGRYPYTGVKAGDETPINRDAIRNAGIEVVVAGKRYGKGSSREHSVVAERAAGVRLVIAESFERIYRQNADNVGLFTSTDFTLVDPVQGDGSIAIDQLVAGRDALTAAILRQGGLLAYGEARLRAGVMRSNSTDSSRPRTLFEKIVERHALATVDTPAMLEVGQGGFVHADYRFIHEYYTGMCAHLLETRFGDSLALFDKSTIITFEDHMSYVHRSPVHVANGLVPNVRSMSNAHRAFVQRHGLVDHGYLEPSLEAGDPGNQGSQGISHALMAEQYALPGQLIAGTDSHTPHSGALGCVAFGVGTTDMANAFVTGAVRITMPAVLRVELDGVMAAGLTAKDVVLHLLADPSIRTGAGVGKVFEFGGSAIRAMSTDERATLTNMTAELGGFTGIVEPDEETVRFVKARRGVDIVIEPWMHSDADARYCDTIEIDVSRLSPMVARPGDPGNGVALRDVTNRVAVDIAYGGSCTAGKREDFDHYHEVLAWAASHGLRVPDSVTLYLQFGTVAVRDYCVARGYLQAFEAVGATILQPACGACANCGPGSSIDKNQVTVSAINRNFPGRSGPGEVWLASPPTVAASAIAGRLVSFEELREGSSELA
ncbi:MAG TPA: aconitase family protein [Casimicrobiaceae bacterium]|nr:aconitase family protein [Casimicrobiaceae bacterium]